MILHSLALLAARVVNLERVNKAASERKQRKKKRIQKGGTLSKVEADELLAQGYVETQLEGGNARSWGPNRRRQRRQTALQKLRRDRT